MVSKYIWDNLSQIKPFWDKLAPKSRMLGMPLGFGAAENYRWSSLLDPNLKFLDLEFRTRIVYTGGDALRCQGHVRRP
jgi:hypothetical protein